MADFNVAVAGLLLEMAALQPSKQAGLGYRRAAWVIFSLDYPLTDVIDAGTLRAIRGVGPAVERIVHEYAQTGRSLTVERALATASTAVQNDLHQRRQVRDGFLSWASARGVLEARLPKTVVSTRTYRGDLQVHTTWSDGADGLATMADAALARGWSRLAVTDHSYGLPIARGMTMEVARRQHVEIDTVNARLDGSLRLLKGIEANILADGRLDMEPDELRQFELVIAAPHSLLRKPFDQTARLLAAVRTPGVHILGHPRGRVFNKRAGIVADWPRVFDEAAARGVAVELDGTWDRQDLDAGLASLAMDAGCVFAIDSDAHAARELSYTDYAMAHARLARLPSARVINCWEDRKLVQWMRAAWRR